MDDLNVPNLEVRRHDITTDALPEPSLDLVHARLVPSHLPARDAGLARMTAALKPDGWLVVEDVDALSACADPGAESACFRWQGGFPGTSIDCANLQQLRAPILASGQLTEPEFERELALLDDPKTVYPSPTLWATWGRRPGAS